MKLPYIFTSYAMFQADTVITIHGVAEKGEKVSCVIANAEDRPVKQANAVADEAGAFLLEIETPSASFTRYTMTVSGEHGAPCRMHDVLFGEVWLASGQSNMELANASQDDPAPLYREVAEKNIRVYQVAYPEGRESAMFPREPDRMASGFWILSENAKVLSGVSAAGLMFVNRLYDVLNADAEVPVAFLNANWGATPFPSWFPLDAVEADKDIRSCLTYPTPEDWNTHGGNNFQQVGAQYNAKIGPLEGLKFRGIIWYQGEAETGAEFERRVYRRYLDFYYDNYAARFAADPDNFRMISSLIYPWRYGESGECSIGYINNAFVEASIEKPEHFLAVPNNDLPPVWAYSRKNHPIHPINKYPLGARMAKLAAANVYHRAEESGQVQPAHLRQMEICGNKLVLQFDSVGTGLFIDGKKPIGLYIAGEGEYSDYLPAECRILSPDRMEIWCDAIPAPKNAAYSIQSLEPMCNLWAGSYPVCPFMTDTEHLIRIEARPWYDTGRTAVWGWQCKEIPQSMVFDLFYHPVWLPEPGSEVCPDPAFTLDGTSLRVCSDSAQFGCYVKSYPYNRLDLQKFRRLTVRLFNTDGLSAVLKLDFENGVLEIPFTMTHAVGADWSEYEAELSGIPQDAEILRMHFRFTQKDSRYHFVNLERPRLYK